MHTTADGPPARLLGRYSYPTGHRVIELLAVALVAGFGSVFVARLGGALAADLRPSRLGLTALAVVLGFVVADLLSGLVHALCDNLGSVDTPLVGQKFIRSFREHHRDPLDMTRGDFVRVNADNFLVSLPVLVPAVLWLDVADHLFLASFVASLTSWVLVTNQIHKWAHLDEVPPSVRWLQQHHLVLSPEHHAVHHTPPYASHYCITSGITNPFLSRIGFWPVLLRACRFAGRALPGSPAAGGSQGPGA